MSPGEAVTCVAEGLRGNPRWLAVVRRAARREPVNDNPVTAHTESRICCFTALDPMRYLTACAFVIVLRVAIVSSISQSDPHPLTHPPM